MVAINCGISPGWEINVVALNAIAVVFPNRRVLPHGELIELILSVLSVNATCSVMVLGPCVGVESGFQPSLE
jgi:hypothetical protein